MNHAISGTFVVSTDAQEYGRDLLAILDGVHRMPAAAPISISRESVAGGLDGDFDPRARKIRIRPGAPFPFATGAHEVGHAIDAFWLNAEGGFLQVAHGQDL